MALNPIPGTTRERNDGHYDADSGVDILVPFGTPVIAPAAGRLIYSEPGHTPWVASAAHPKDTPNSVLLELDKPIMVDGIEYPYLWFTHLSSLMHLVRDGEPPLRVQAGALIGSTGVGNSVPHLHFGIIRRRAQAGPSDWLAPAKAVEIIWAGDTPAPPDKSVKVQVNLGKAAVAFPKCRAEVDETGTLRADVRPLLQALGWDVDASELLASGKVVVSRRR